MKRRYACEHPAPSLLESNLASLPGRVILLLEVQDGILHQPTTASLGPRLGEVEEPLAATGRAIEQTELIGARRSGSFSSQAAALLTLCPRAWMRTHPYGRLIGVSLRARTEVDWFGI